MKVRGAQNFLISLGIDSIYHQYTTNPVLKYPADLEFLAACCALLLHSKTLNWDISYSALNLAKRTYDYRDETIKAYQEALSHAVNVKDSYGITNATENLTRAIKVLRLISAVADKFSDHPIFKEPKY